MESKNRTSLLIGIVFLIMSFLANSIYHNHLNNNGPDLFRFTGSLSCLFYVIGFSLVFLIKTFSYPSIVIVVVSLISIINEIKQFQASGILDVNNIVASLIGGVIAFLIWKAIEKRSTNQEKNSIL
ncbi:MAG: hypothetical protein WCP85_15445 [Mariniphaga sp.]